MKKIILNKRENALIENSLSNYMVLFIAIASLLCCILNHEGFAIFFILIYLCIVIYKSKKIRDYLKDYKNVEITGSKYSFKNPKTYYMKKEMKNNGRKVT